MRAQSSLVADNEKQVLSLSVGPRLNVILHGALNRPEKSVNCPVVERVFMSADTLDLASNYAEREPVIGIADLVNSDRKVRVPGAFASGGYIGNVDVGRGCSYR